MCSSYRPGSASLNESESSNSQSWIISQQSSQVFTESGDMYPSAIISIVSLDGQKYCPQHEHLICMVSIIRVRYQQMNSSRLQLK
jgi:hypothetical protein